MRYVRGDTGALHGLAASPIAWTQTSRHSILKCAI